MSKIKPGREKGDFQPQSHLTEDELMLLVNCSDPLFLETPPIKKQLDHIAACEQCYSLFTAMSALNLALKNDPSDNALLLKDDLSVNRLLQTDVPVEYKNLFSLQPYLLAQIRFHVRKTGTNDQVQADRLWQDPVYLSADNPDFFSYTQENHSLHIQLDLKDLSSRKLNVSIKASGEEEPSDIRMQEYQDYLKGTIQEIPEEDFDLMITTLPE